ncbi:MAG: HAD-IA family hydrolase [Prevotella sp.]|nr:HAD-IA family hydrolase [Prevotella sp.]
MARFWPEAVLFDMDGVLYDSMPNHAVAWQQAMAQFGITMTAEDAYATEGARGVDTIKKMVWAQQNRTISTDEAMRMYEAKAKIFHSMPQAKIFDGVFDLMRLFKDKACAIGIVTGSAQRPLIARMLADFADFVDENRVVTAFDVERGKPAPDPYLMGMEKCACTDAKRCLVVENAPLGVEAAVAAGCRTIAVNTGPLADEILSNKGAERIFKSIRELYNFWVESYKKEAVLC